MVADILIGLLFLALAVCLFEIADMRRKLQDAKNVYVADVSELLRSQIAAEKTIASYEYARSIKALQEDGPRSS